MPPGFEQPSVFGWVDADEKAAVLVRGYRHCAVDYEGEHTKHAYFPQLPIWQQRTDPVDQSARRVACGWCHSGCCCWGM